MSVSSLYIVEKRQKEKVGEETEEGAVKETSCKGRMYGLHKGHALL